MAKRERNRRPYRIVLSDGESITEVSRQDFDAHLAAHRIERFKHDDRKAATTSDWVSYIDFNTSELMFTARETKAGIALPTNSKHLLDQLRFKPPYNEWLLEQEFQVYRRADA
jgi:hypothetical protein